MSESKEVIPEAAVEAVASIIYRTSGRRRVMSYEDARDACESEALEYLEAAAPLLMAAVWQSAYRLGVGDERTSQANPGIAGCFCNSSPCQCIIEPARVNPYEARK
jgi:hypothetical protein